LNFAYQYWPWHLLPDCLQIVSQKYIFPRIDTRQCLALFNSIITLSMSILNSVGNSTLPCQI
jgi:hypothetical protein